MKIVGLTGGIASGKSTASRLLASWDVPVVDADQLSREVMTPGGSAYPAVARRWPEAVRADGTLDRSRLGAIVFADPAQRSELTAIVVPQIVAAFQQRLAALRAEGRDCVVLEAATLIEEGLDHTVDGVLLVAASPEVQIGRLVARNRLTEEQARQRLAAQLPLEAKRARATWVLDNDGTEEHLAAALRALWERVRRELGLASGPA